MRHLRCGILDGYTTQTSLFLSFFLFDTHHWIVSKDFAAKGFRSRPIIDYYQSMNDRVKRISFYIFPLIYWRTWYFFFFFLFPNSIELSKFKSIVGGLSRGAICFRTVLERIENSCSSKGWRGLRGSAPDRAKRKKANVDKTFDIRLIVEVGERLGTSTRAALAIYDADGDSSLKVEPWAVAKLNPA